MTVLQHVVSGRRFKPPRIIVYGPEKIGKTTFLAEMPRPIIIQTEDGADNIDCDRLPKCETYSELMMYLEGLLKEEHKYKTIGLDSLDWAEKLIFTRVAEDEGKDDIEKIGYARGYKLALKYWADVLAMIDRVMNERNMAFCGICHSSIKEFHNPDGENWDQFNLNLHKNSVETVKQWADAIMFCNYKVFTKTTGEGFAKEVKAISGGPAPRVMYANARPAFVAGNRYGLPDEIPMIQGETWNTIQGHLAKNQPKKAATVKPKAESKQVAIDGDEIPY